MMFFLYFQAFFACYAMSFFSLQSKAIAERRIKSTLLTLSLKRLSRFALIKSKTAREKTQEV